ncbi:Protein of unknown function [Bacillus mycoides]|uniref:Uncharacterized protein n=1 Tax=Bacillus mycoides TaxID=1405 RepID=A0A1G4LCD1_BACMY|nr:Protein of unknown function [Bacillus mycoides]
MEDGERPR